MVFGEYHRTVRSPPEERGHVVIVLLPQSHLPVQIPVVARVVAVKRLERTLDPRPDQAALRESGLHCIPGGTQPREFRLEAADAGNALVRLIEGVVQGEIDPTPSFPPDLTDQVEGSEVVVPPVCPHVVVGVVLRAVVVGKGEVVVALRVLPGDQMAEVPALLGEHKVRLVRPERPVRDRAVPGVPPDALRPDVHHAADTPSAEPSGRRPLVHLDPVHVGQGDVPEVHAPSERAVQRDPVEIYLHLLRGRPPDGDRAVAAQAPQLLHLHAGSSGQHLRQRDRLPLEGLRRDHPDEGRSALCVPLRVHHDLLQMHRQGLQRQVHFLLSSRAHVHLHHGAPISDHPPFHPMSALGHRVHAESSRGVRIRA